MPPVHQSFCRSSVATWARAWPPTPPPTHTTPHPPTPTPTPTPLPLLRCLQVRKATAPAFSLDNIRRAFPAVLGVASEVCDHLAAQLAAGQAEVDITDAAMRLLLDVIGQTGYGCGGVGGGVGGVGGGGRGGWG